MKARDQAGGFALIQAIATLGLSALLVLLMVTMGGLVARNSQITMQQSQDVETLASALSVVRRDIEAGLLMKRGPATDAEVFFVGKSDRMAMAVRDRSSQGDAVIFIAARNGGQRGALLRNKQPMPSNQQFSISTLPAQPWTLITGPWHFAFAYAEGGKAGLSWHKDWQARGHIPTAVRVDVSPTEPLHRRIPSLIVPIRVDELPPCSEQQQPCDREAD